MTRTYTCEGCGKTFTGTPHEAFEAGWDTPERFMGHCTCESCPITTTLWWRMQVDGQTELTSEEYAMLLEYNRIYEAAAAEEEPTA
jgi:hypothetical protein